MGKRPTTRITKALPSGAAPEVIVVLQTGTTQHVLQYVPLASIEVLRNTRQHYDEPAMLELIESIQAHGVLQSIALRPHPEMPGRYQLAAGHRRYFGAQRAGLAEIPASIRPLTDREFMEVQLLENLQRQDVHPADEAAAFAELLVAGWPAEEIGAKIGKGAAFVVRRAKLLDLTPHFLEALRGQRLPLGAAEQLARLSLEQQDEAQRQLSQYWREHLEVAGERLRLYSAKEVREYIGRHVGTRNLEEAPFLLDDAGLLPPAGACLSCSKRSGNRLYLFEDMGKDRCLDPGCYQQKGELFLQHQLETMADDLANGQVLRIAPDFDRVANDTLNRHYYAELHDDADRDMLAAEGRLRRALVVRGPQAGQVRDVVIDQKFADNQNVTETYGQMRRERKQEIAQEKAGVATTNQARREAHARLGEAVRAGGQLQYAVLREMVHDELQYSCTKTLRGLLVQEYSWEVADFKSYSQEDGVLDREIARMPSERLWTLLLDVQLQKWAEQEYDGHFKRMNKALGWEAGELVEAGNRRKAQAKAGKEVTRA